MVAPVRATYPADSPLKVYVLANANISLNSVSTCVLPNAGAPSSSFPLPIYNLRSSNAQPNSAPDSCGKSVSNPLRCVIFDICVIAILF